MVYKSIKQCTADEDCITGGSPACAGCGAILGLKLVTKVLGPNTVGINASGCMTLLTIYPSSPFKFSWEFGAIENGPAVAEGIRRSLDLQGKEDTNVFCFIGDGATYEIGFQALSSAALKNKNIIYICYNNEVFGNTGGQWAASTPYGSDTTTTPRGKENPFGNTNAKKDVPRIMANHGVYVATVSLSDPVDFMNKIEKAKNRDGFSYIEILIPCTTGWKYDPKYTIEYARRAVKSGVWPLYEIEDGILTVNKKPKELKPVEDFLQGQGRYKKLPPKGVAKLQKIINLNWKDLLEDDGKKMRLKATSL